MKSYGILDTSKELKIMRIVNKEEFESIKNDGVLFVDFYADWCGPCKMVGPVLEELADEYEGKVNIVKVNVDKEGELAQEYGVMSIPNMFLLKDGKVVKNVVGFQPKPALKQLFDSVL